MARPDVVVHLVHGTWPYGTLVACMRRNWLVRWVSCGSCRKRFARRLWRERLWFQPRSSFRVAVKANINDRNVRFVAFRWSGGNSFCERFEAAEAFRGHLAKWFAKEKQARHLVVAHSHGGTVAICGLGDPSKAPPGSLGGILTMATPFVTLDRVPRSGPDAVVRYAAAPFMFILLLLTILSGMLAIGLKTWVGGGLLGYWIPLVGAGLIGLVLLAEKLHLGNRFERTLDELQNLIDFQCRPPVLPCELRALRAPGDEASYAIAAAQIVERLTAGIWWLLVRTPLGLLERIEASSLKGWHVTLGTWTVCSLVYLACFWWVVGEPPTIWQILFAGPYCAGGLIFLLLIALAVSPLLILTPSVVALASAVGPEAIRYPGIATIEAEALPPGVSAQVVMLSLTESERANMKMRHSVHQLPLARTFVANWIRQNSA